MTPARQRVLFEPLEHARTKAAAEAVARESVRAPEPAILPYAAPPEDHERLGGHCRTILTMLRQKARTGPELAAATSWKFAARLTDLRKHGYRIGAKRLFPNNGTFLYWLETDPRRN